MTHTSSRLYGGLFTPVSPISSLDRAKSDCLPITVFCSRDLAKLHDTIAAMHAREQTRA